MSRDVAITTTIQAEIDARLREKAAREDRSKASIVRQALAAFLREQ